jgi:hypothetical protein
MDTVFARSGHSSVLGGFTAEIPKLKIPEETKEILDREARKAGLNTSEFCKYVLMVRAHGQETLIRLEQERLAVVAGKGDERG